jgi:hypothetical protein
MIDVRVSEEDRIDACGPEWKGTIVESFEAARSLEKSAVDQNAALRTNQLAARSGDRTRGAMKTE